MPPSKRIALVLGGCCRSERKAHLASALLRAIYWARCRLSHFQHPLFIKAVMQVHERMPKVIHLIAPGQIPGSVYIFSKVPLLCTKPRKADRRQWFKDTPRQRGRVASGLAGCKGVLPRGGGSSAKMQHKLWVSLPLRSILGPCFEMRAAINVIFTVFTVALGRLLDCSCGGWTDFSSCRPPGQDIREIK